MTDTPFVPPDPAQLIADFSATMAGLAHRAAAFARAGDARAAILTAGEMQMLLRRRGDAVRRALETGRSKRIPPVQRAAIRAAAHAALPPVQREMRAFAADTKARLARQAAIGAAISAKTRAPAGVYGASLRRGVRLMDRTVRHTVTVTA